LTIVDVLACMQVDNSLGHLVRSFIRIWTYPPCVPPPLYIFNQEENTTYSEDIGLEERQEEERSEEMR
jgi:hypothetical protein